MKESNLPVNCVLQQILNVQRHVYDFFSSVKLNEGVKEQQQDEVQKGETDNQCDNRNEIIKQKLLRDGGGSFKQYQYGATALDCSLMITFQRISGAGVAIDEALTKKFMVQQDSVRFLSKITIMDLDPKPFTHAVKYLEQTQASYRSQKQSSIF